MVLLFIFSYPLGITVFLEIKTMYVKNDFQMYSFIVCCLIVVALFLEFLISWLVVLIHFKYKGHPLLSEKYSFIYNAVKSERLLY